MPRVELARACNGHVLARREGESSSPGRSGMPPRRSRSHRGCWSCARLSPALHRTSKRKPLSLWPCPQRCQLLMKARNHAPSEQTRQAVVQHFAVDAPILHGNAPGTCRANSDAAGAWRAASPWCSGFLGLCSSSVRDAQRRERWSDARRGGELHQMQITQMRSLPDLTRYYGKCVTDYYY